MAILLPRWLLTAALLLVVRATNAQSGIEERENLTQRKRSIAETEFENLLLRAKQRRAAGGSSSDAGRKYTSEHTDLVNDVVRSFDKALSLSGQHEVLQRLIADLEMLPMTKGTFCERAGAIRKAMGYCGKKPGVKAVKSSVGVENSRILDSVFQENPNISTNEAFDALQKKLKGQPFAGPTLPGVRHWLKYRKSRMRGARSAGVKPRVKPKSAGTFDEDVYKNLLHRARERRSSVENVSLGTNGYHKYTAEHYALIEDVVRSCDEFFDHCGLFEVFKRLLSDLGMSEVNRNTFNNRVVALRKQMGGDTQTSQTSPCAHLLQTCQGVILENNLEACGTHVSSCSSSSAADDYDSFWSEVLSVLGPESDPPVDDGNFIDSPPHAESCVSTACKKRRLL